MLPGWDEILMQDGCERDWQTEQSSRERPRHSHRLLPAGTSTAITSKILSVAVMEAGWKDLVVLHGIN